MNLEINTPGNKINISYKFSDRILAILKPDILQTTPQHEVNTVGSGEKHDNCGEISAIWKCKTCGETHIAEHHCDRLACPICHPSAAARIGKRSSAILRTINEALSEHLSLDRARDVYGRQLPNASICTEYHPETIKLANIMRSGGVRHIVMSPPKAIWPEFEKYSNTQMINAFKKHIEKYLPRSIGGLFIYHPHRIKPEIRIKLEHHAIRQQYHQHKNKNSKIQRKVESKNAKAENHEIDIFKSKGYWDAIHRNVLNLPSYEDYVYFSPHYHTIQWGTMPNATQYHTETKGWVYKITDHGKSIPLKIIINEGQPLKDILRAKITYLASHAGLYTKESGRTCDVVHYFGIASPKSRMLCKTQEGKKITKRIYQSYIDCEKCGPGNHLTLCDKDEIPILGREGEIYAQDKLVVYKSELTSLGKRKVEKLLNLNWPVSRIQMDVEGIIQIPDPPPKREKAHFEA